jgi:chlorobactene glucosyltransferase
MLIQIIIAVILVLILANLILNLKHLKSPSTASKLPQNAPFVSVLIPARNEEANIAQCLDSLCKQDYPHYEIIVLDDASTDQTAPIVNWFAARNKCLKIITGQPLPPGWSGKNYACHQLAKGAKGEWLLFVDADTMHAPHMLRSITALALELNPSLLSGFPQQVSESFIMKLFTPVWYFILMAWCPLWWMQNPKRHMPSIAIGQFMLFSRREYNRIGGHEAIKSKVLEDIWLGIEVYKNGGKHIAVDLSEVVFCKMYDNVRGIWNGLTRSVYAIAEFSSLALIFLIFMAFICFLVPFYSLLHGSFFSDVGAAVAVIVILQIVLTYLTRWLADSHFNHNFSVPSVFLHPIGIIFLILIVANAITRKTLGAGISWKERLYIDEPTADEKVTGIDPNKLR